eukprot:CAMPEP_0194046410 /NCGR_PEP_ID=MMETSP0009_2-20130614/21087_1 /TAXON_ID=210454 /ORGANISM="Grammatophora oceanica, Strain CCMP 410" /LENGTH=112 /DNA_ID=CAMNT_0038691685 /DNA_START=1451 /DNA_END=1786 /DNA_ORIENTATION=-
MLHHPTCLFPLTYNRDSGNIDETELLALLQLLRSKNEAFVIGAYLLKLDSSAEVSRSEAISKLGECEKYMASMLYVEDAAKKFECMLHKVQLQSFVKDLGEAVACARNSNKL